MAFIFATPHSTAFCACADPVTRAPTSSLNSVKYWNACESIIPSPAIFTRAGFVPSSLGPFAVDCSSARAASAATNATAAIPTKILRIPCSPCASRKISAHDSTTPSDGDAAKPSPRTECAVLRARARVWRATSTYPPLYRTSLSPYTACEAIVKATRAFLSAIPVVAILCFLGASTASPRLAQDATQKPAEKAPEKAQDKGPEKSQEKAGAKPAPKLPAEIELLETSVRFEADGSSRKEVHARVKINDELGVRQFAHLNFDFNRTFEQVEIPLVHITHPSGGTADVLPSAITDNPNPAVVNAPAYQDVRVKSLRILGLEPGDSLEYRVVTTVAHHPLAPDFWLEHTFDRTGVVSEELFELDLPASRNAEIRTNPATPATSTEKSGDGDTARTKFRWKMKATGLPKEGQNTEKLAEQVEPDVALSTE